MKKLLIATVLTAVYGIGGVTFASTNDVQNNNEPIKMNLLVERNHDDANNFQDKKCDMLLENQNNQMHKQDRMEHMSMNHQVDNMHRKDNDQSMRPEGQNHQMPLQDQPSHGDRHNDNAPQQQTGQGAPQTTQN